MSDPIILDCDENEDELDNGKKSDFVAVSGNIISSINYKLGLFMFMLGMLVFSDLFIEKILGGLGGAVDGECTTTKGTIIQLVMFVILMLALDVLIKWGWL
jgi:hypothetical protein